MGVETIDDELIQNEDISSIFTNEQRKSCDGLLIEQEYDASLQCFNIDNTPDCNGIPLEFYLEFRQYIGPKLVASLNYCGHKGLLSILKSRGIISLL